MEPSRSSQDSMDRLSTVQLEVRGMHCQSCVALVEDTLVAHRGVKSARVDLESSLASLSYDPNVVGVPELCSAVADVGYTAVESSGAPRLGP